VSSTVLEAVDQVCRDRIEPAALAVDADVVPRSHLDALASTGLFAGVTAGTGPAVVRAAHERLAGACLSTWFVVAQHQTPLQLVRAAPQPLRSAVLPLLESGTTVAGIAFSHLRRWPHRPVEVESLPGGWRFTGTAPWYTGWGINDVMVLAGASPSGTVVFALVPAEPSERLRPGEPLDTLAMTAARTVPLLLDGLVVPEDGIVAVSSMDDWAVADRSKTANVSPAVLGVAAAATERLLGGDDESGQAAGAALKAAVDEVRSEAYDLIDNAEPGQHLDRRVDLRALALTLCVEATTALVVSRGGRAMLRSDDAQLLARWALFLTVQAQTPALRSALLASLARSGAPC
jgi:alkylation response protein AidB-like acyl-CoA dehydrogenase